MNKYIKIILSFTFCIFIFYGCEKEYITPKTTVHTTAISFSKDIVPIFQSNCVSCHNNIGPLPNLSVNPYQNLISGGYINLASPASSTIYAEMISGMGNTSTDQQQEVLNWISQGALNN